MGSLYAEDNPNNLSVIGLNPVRRPALNFLK
jgi:hypothetical protein